MDNCFYCERPFNVELKKNSDFYLKHTIDHILPRSKGGTDQSWNLVDCCHVCNLYKADYTIDEFEQLLETSIENKLNAKGLSVELRQIILKNVRVLKQDNYRNNNNRLSFSSIKKKRASIRFYSTIQPYEPEETEEVNKKEYNRFLILQTPEQFHLAQKFGWQIAKLLTEPEKNFHEID